MKFQKTFYRTVIATRSALFVSFLFAFGVYISATKTNAAENSQNTRYVDTLIESNSCRNYDPLLRRCDGGTFRAYAEISAAANQVEAGMTLLIQPGNYDGGITVDTGGSESQPVIFQATAPGVIINGSGRNRDAFYITEADYVIVDGLTILDATRAGIRISLSHHVTVRNCTLQDNGSWGLFTDFSDYTTVENCVASGSKTQHGIYISNSSDFPIIRGNRIHNNAAAGLHLNGDGSMGGDGVVSNALVENNIIYENGNRGASAINMDGVTHSIVRNNLIYQNYASGISLFREDGSDESHSNQILNNTIVMATNARWAINMQNSRNNKLFNNIILNNHRVRGSILVRAPISPDFESDFNLVTDRFASDGEGDFRIGLTAWQALGFDHHSLTASAEEIFINVRNNDYRLKQESPAINSGTVLEGVTADLEGKPRPGGEFVDLGAYEF